jgi:hypothetical protein
METITLGSLPLHIMYYDPFAKCYHEPGKHVVVEPAAVADVNLFTMPWSTDKWAIWRHLRMELNGEVWSMGCLRAVKHKTHSKGLWFLGGTNESSPGFKTISGLMEWLKDKVIKRTCSDGSGSYTVRIDRAPRRNEIWIEE